jgi:hypothetical protein
MIPISCLFQVYASVSLIWCSNSSRVSCTLYVLSPTLIPLTRLGELWLQIFNWDVVRRLAWCIGNNIWYTENFMSRVAKSVQCLTTDCTAGVRSPTEAEDFSSNLCVQTGSGAHPASYTMGTRGSFPRGKVWPGRNADHSPPSSAKVKK